MKHLGLMILVGAVLSGSLWGKGVKDTSAMDKDQYIKHVESKLGDWDKSVSELKAERDKLATKTDRHKSLDKAVKDIEEELGDVREELQELRASTEARWTEHRTDIDKNFADAQSAHNRVKPAE